MDVTICAQTYFLSNGTPQRSLTYVDEVFGVIVQISYQLMLTKASTRKFKEGHNNLQPTFN